MFKIGEFLTHKMSYNKKELLIYLGGIKVFLVYNNRGFYDGRIYDVKLDCYVSLQPKDK